MVSGWRDWEQPLHTTGGGGVDSLEEEIIAHLLHAGGPGAGLPAPQQLVGSLTTSEFPMPCGRKRTRRGTRLGIHHRGRHEAVPMGPPPANETCCVCLEEFHVLPTAVLACHHVLHEPCLWGLQTNNTLGASSMMRCPLCRHPLDRHSLTAMGYDVRPSQLRRIGRACHAFRSLMMNDSWRHRCPCARRKSLVQAIVDCRSLTALDGFLYNTCLCALERMLQHKTLIVHTLESQLRHPPEGWGGGGKPAPAPTLLLPRMTSYRTPLRTMWMFSSTQQT